MDTNVNYTLVGAFVITLVAAIVLTIVWLSSGLSWYEKSNYLIFSQESVSGLSVDAQVEYNGVKVGEVKEINIVKNNPRLVKLKISIDNKTPITKGTIASLTSRGVTGVAFIALKDEGNDLTPLVATKGYPYPVIPTGPSLFLRLDLALQKLTKSLETVANAFAGLLDKDNLKSFKGILRGLDIFMTELAGDSKKINKFITNAAEASEQFTPFFKKGNNTLDALDTQALPVTYQMLANMNEMMRTLNEVSRQIKQNPSVLIRGAAPLPPGPGEGR